MKPEAYHAFTQNLQSNLENDSRVLGLVVVGSTARQSHMPDQWSDHDFFVIVQPGTQQEFRQSLNWLPDSARIMLSFRETEHGMKVLYDDGHLLEFAIFDEQEIFLARINDYAVLFDRANIEHSVKQIQQDSKPSQWNEHHEFGMFITNLMVGAGRYARGEMLSGHVFVKVNALSHLLRLLAHYGDTSNRDSLDNLDAFRRFERAFPEIGAEINDILLLPPIFAAGMLLDVAERHLKNRIAPYPDKAVRVVSSLIDSLIPT